MQRIISSCKTLTVLVVILSCLNHLVHAGTAESILIKENEHAFEIGVPVSNLSLFLPKGNFKSAKPPPREGRMANLRYFQFADNTTSVTLSGWFENAKRFKGLGSNTKCNTSGPVGLRCCHEQEILHTHECRRT